MQKYLLIFFITIFTFGLQLDSAAQKTFNINKRGKVKRIKYYIGQDITLKYNDTKQFGQITAMGDSSISLEGVVIPLSSIDYVVHPRKAFIWWFLRNVGYRAGVGYFILDGGNRLIYNESPIIDDRTLSISIPLIGLGVIGSLMKNRRFQNKGYNMNINDMELIK